MSGVDLTCRQQFVTSRILNTAALSPGEDKTNGRFEAVPETANIHSFF